MFSLFIVSCTSSGDDPDIDPTPDPEINVAPTIPQAEGAVYKSCLSIRPTLKWKACSDANGDRVSYEIKFGKEESSLTSIAKNLETTTFTFSDNLLVSSKYYWMVTVSDGNLTTDSEIWSFSTVSEAIENEIPSSPILLKPFGKISTTDVLFDWEDAVDDGAVSYVLYVKNETNEIFTYEVSESSYLLKNLERGSWCWWVLVKDESGNESQSCCVNFVLD